MYKLIIAIIFMTCISCNSKKQETKNTIANTNMNITSPLLYAMNANNTSSYNYSSPYDIFIDIKKIKSNNYNLVVKMELNNGSIYISPNSVRDFKGKFSLKINESDKFEKTSNLIEKPLSVETYDYHPFVQGNVNWVKNNTTYTQKLKLNSEENFKVSGYIQFTIEPRCTLEKIPFVIIHEKGKMKIELIQDKC